MSQELVASMQHAESLLKGRDAEGALEVLSPALAARPVLPRAHMIAAMAKLRQGRASEAVGHLDLAAGVLDRAAAAPAAFLALARHYSGARAFDQAGEMLRKGRARFPDNAELAVAEGDHCERLGRRGEAIAAYRAAIALAPDSGEAWSSLAIALHKNGDMAAAIDGYGQALARGARTGGVYNNLIAALIATGDPAAALATAEDWLAAMPGSIEALSFKALLLTETGQPLASGAAHRLRPVHAGRDHRGAARLSIARPVQPGARGRGAGPSEARDAAREPPDLASSGLADRQSQARRQRRADRRSPSDHAPVGRAIISPRPPGRIGIRFWRTGRAPSRSPPGRRCSKGEGNQQPHVHIDGYLSGCYYVTIPQEIASDDNGRDGVILGGFEAGRPPEELGLKAAFPSRTIKPKEGMMVLFPAYLYHATVPFRSSERRISIAFDVLPEGGRPKRG